ncbi:MAG: chloride channel protein [Alphaproteobacteria bacterium]|nr:chloride channel protein [Alphaproteobacteria bacterium]
MAFIAEPVRLEKWLRRARAILTAVQRDLRDAEPGQILLCAAMGCFIGAVVDLLREGVAWLHVFDFGIPADHYLSEGVGVSRARLLFVPLLGGLILGLAARAVRAKRLNEIVDPIEANALHGGRMSLRDSLWLTFTTVISNGAGASLGMEAGYSQLGAGIYSWAGRWFRLRRADLRVFVTAGAGAAIAAAFNAPLAGAFYGYELILGSYTTKALAPVVVASVCAALTQRAMSHMKALFDVTGNFNVTSASYVLFAVLGVGAAAVAVAAMQAVTWTERGLRASRLPDWLRPAVGGALLSGLALFAPQVLGSGHGAVQFHFDIRWTFWGLAALLALKLVASAISVGSGFRGGLFSSGLFLGTLFGAVFAQGAAYISPALEAQHNVFMLAGMGAVAAAIIGAPLTMVFLVLEATGDFQVTIAVVIAVTVASTIVRIMFGYSFATWRFHLRGLSIRGAHDVGWIRDMSVGRLMRNDAKTVPENLGLRALRAAYPVGGTKRLYVVDGSGRYIGSIDTADLHDAEIDDALDGAVAGDLAEGADQFLLPSENIRSALTRFDALQIETLPVLLSSSQRTVVGYMTEAYALKRYSAELERMRSAELGQRDLFSIGPLPNSRTPGH